MSWQPELCTGSPPKKAYSATQTLYNVIHHNIVTKDLISDL